jgi:hypothetical protein
MTRHSFGRRIKAGVAIVVGLKIDEMRGRIHVAVQSLSNLPKFRPSIASWSKEPRVHNSDLSRPNLYTLSPGDKPGCSNWDKGCKEMAFRLLQYMEDVCFDRHKHKS